ncbi:MAG: hypothetical protein ACK4RK_21115 [Gemmataceae bacterium]
MIDAVTCQLLQNVLSRESRSLLQYVGDSFPWVTPEEPELLATLENIIAEERQVLTQLGRWLTRQRCTIPPLPPFPLSYTSVNNTELKFVVPLLITEQRQSLERLRKVQNQLKNEEARSELQQLIDIKQRHLHQLETLPSAHAEPAAT